MSARHAETARRYWTTYLPSRVATISDQEAFFRDLSEQVDDQIAAALLSPPTLPKDATSQERVAAHQAQARAAKEEALNDLVFLKPEPGTENRRLEGWTLPGWADEPPTPPSSSGPQGG